MVANGSVQCPLSLCGQTHELRTDRSGNAYIACGSWKLSVWFRGLGAQFLNRNNGGPFSRENPRQIVETVGPAEPIESEWDDDEPHPLALLCSECGTPIRVRGMTSCNTCGTPIQWE